MKQINVIITVDDRGGIMFNKRRQSRDKKVIEDIAAIPRSVYVSRYTAPLFDGTSANIVVCDSPLDDCPDGAYAFVEGEYLGDYKDSIKTLTVYRWNRHYPSDKKLDISIAPSEFSLGFTEEFAGFSHEKITKEVYNKKP